MRPADRHVKDLRQQRLDKALARLSKKAQEKILATVEDTSEPIIIGNWTALYGKLNDPEKKPKPCGCLMLDGYLHDKSTNFTLELVWTPSRQHWQMDYVEDWASLLADYYDMPNGENEVGEVAEAFDSWATFYYNNEMKFAVSPFQKKLNGGSYRQLNARGRREVAKMLRNHLAEGNHREEW
jgi:hypothetical protein